MGTILKGLAFLIGLSVLGLGAGVLAIPFFLYAFWGLLFGCKRPQGNYDSRSKPRGGAGPSLWNRNPWRIPGSTVRPVRDSILLQSTLMPLRWFSVSEVKLQTRNVAGVLSSVNAEMLIDASKGSVYIIIEVLALNHSQAFEKSTARLRDICSVLSPLDGYLIPLASEDAVAPLGANLKEVKVDPRNWKNSVQTSPYDFLALDTRGGLVGAIGLYRRTGEKSAKPRTIRPSRRISMPPITWGVIKALEQRISWPEPDDIAGFVASLAATRGEPLARRLDGDLDGETVRTLTTMGRRIQLRLAQLRALVSLYE